MSNKQRVTADRLAKMSALERERVVKVISSLIIRRREEKLRQERLREVK